MARLVPVFFWYFAFAVSATAVTVHAEPRLKLSPAQECAVEFGRIAPEQADIPASVIWSPQGERKVEDMAGKLNGLLNVVRGEDGKVVYEIDIPRADVPTGSRSIRRVETLPNGEGAYQFPRLEIRVQSETAGKEIILMSGNARGVVENGVAFVDGNVSDGLGLRIHVPDLRSSAVVIDAGLMSKKNLTDPNSHTTVVPLLDTAMDLLKAVAPNRATILKARDGSFYRLPGGTTWERVN